MQVRIISPTEAKEVNKYGEEPHAKNMDFMELWNTFLAHEKWKKAEASCKTYKIECCDKNCICMPNQDEPFSCEIIGSIHEAELLESGMIKIID